MKTLPFNSLIFIRNLSINLTFKSHCSFYMIWDFSTLNRCIIDKCIFNIKYYISVFQIRKFFIHNLCNGICCLVFL